MSSVELVDEPDAIGELKGGEIVGKVKRSTVRRFEFPAQEHGFDSGAAAEDPVSHKTWTVVAVDEALGTIDLKIGNADHPCRQPSSREGQSTRKSSRHVCAIWPNMWCNRVSAALMRHRPCCDAVGQTPASQKGVPYDTTMSQPAKPPSGSSSV